MRKKLKTDVKPKKEKLRLTENLAELSGPIIRVSGNREAAVDGCRGVTDYYENMIKLNITGGSVTFTGTNLAIVELTGDAALIRGKIEMIEYNVRAET